MIAKTFRDGSSCMAISACSLIVCTSKCVFYSVDEVISETVVKKSTVPQVLERFNSDVAWKFSFHLKMLIYRVCVDLPDGVYIYNYIYYFIYVYILNIYIYIYIKFIIYFYIYTYYV